MDKTEFKKGCLSFFYWWYNEPGNNTEEGFEKWHNEVWEPDVTCSEDISKDPDYES